jgi:hypothetical protein
LTAFHKPGYPTTFFKIKGTLSFRNETNNWGLQTSNVSNGAAYADLDNDGDLDLVVNNMGSNASVYRNNNPGKSNYLNIRLKGTKENTLAIGSHVTITSSRGKQQVAEQQPVRGYLSSMEPLIHFGLGADTTVQSLTIRWPQGGHTTIKNIKPNQTITVNIAEVKG